MYPKTGRHCYKTNINFFTLAAVAKRYSANHFQVILPGAITKMPSVLTNHNSVILPFML